MAGDATEVNAAMETLRNAIAAYNQQPMSQVSQDPPPPIDEDPEETEEVDCVKLAALMDELRQMDIDNCTGV